MNGEYIGIEDNDGIKFNYQQGDSPEWSEGRLELADNNRILWKGGSENSYYKRK